MSKFALVFLLLCSCAAWSDPTITVNAGSVGTTINTRFGHNTEFYQNAREMWNPTSKQVKQSAKDAMQVAGISTGGLVRCFGGDEYHWRRGVGPLNKRPADVLKNRGYPENNNVGTDELMIFIAQAWPEVSGVKPMMIANYWDFNRPDRDPPEVDPHHQPDSGIQEAANWVEYCNMAVDGDLIAYGDSHWVPSRFVLPAHEQWQNPPESVDVSAVEWKVKDSAEWSNG